MRETQQAIAAARRLVLWPIAMGVVGMLITLVMVLALVALGRLPPEPISANLRISIEEGSLIGADWAGFDRVRGHNQYNDCLIIMMTRFQRDPVESAIAPLVIFNDYPRPLLDGASQLITECDVAIAAIRSDRPLHVYPPEFYEPYQRYVFGFRIPFQTLISFTTIGTIRILYRTAGVALLLFLIVGHCVRAVRNWRRNDRAKAIAGTSYVVLGSGLALFSGLDIYGQSLSHAPSDILLFAALCWLSFGKPMAGLRGDLTAATLAALAFAFEFLHGTLPMMLAIILGTLALNAFALRHELRILDLVRATAAFVLGVVGSAITKLATVIWLMGVPSAQQYLGQLSYRMSGASLSVADAFTALWNHAFFIGWGAGWLIKPVLLGACLATCGAAIAILRLSGWRLMAALTALASSGVIFGWYVVFHSHTAIHATFMVRILAWPIGMSVVCLLLALWPDDHRTATERRFWPGRQPT